MDTKGLKEHRKWWDFPVPAWVGIVFVTFCIAMAIVAMVTVTSDDDAPIEYRVSHQTSEEDEYGGKKEIYWRVKSTEIPRWKRFANRWRKLKKAHIFWESGGGYTRSDKRTLTLSHQNAEWADKYNVIEFGVISGKYQTVGGIKAYKKKQKEIMKTGTRRAIERKKKREDKERIKNIWDEAVNATATCD